MIFSPATTIFLNCLYCCISGTHVINDCSNLVNKLFQASIFHLSTQNWLKTSIGSILNISIPVPYSLSMPESATGVVGNLIVLKTNSPVSELSSDVFSLQHLTFFLAGRDQKLFFISIFCALRNHDQYASDKHHQCENLKKRFGTT